MDNTQHHDIAHTYLEDVLALHGLSKKLAPLLRSLLMNQNSSNPIFLNNYVKKELESLSKLSKGSIDNAIVKFVDVGLLTRLDRGTYEANPILKKLNRLLQDEEVALELTYKKGNRRIELSEQTE